MIREGINVAEKDQDTTIPKNYHAVIDHTTACKTTVRKPRDYPVLQERFVTKQ
jgi:hypothetical protein